MFVGNDKYMSDVATTPQQNAFVLEASGLTKTYGATKALDSLDIRVRTGEALAIMGASGSGKTTLLHALAGITKPDRGTVNFYDPRLGGSPCEVTALNASGRSRLRREAFGFVFQQGLLLPELTAAENVALPLMIIGVQRAEAEQRAAGLLAELGLTGLEQRRIGQLSGGQAQRVAIARAQACGGPVVFADEPTGALDSQTSREVIGALLHTTTGAGRTMVLVTHDPGVAARCDRIIEVRDGRIVGERAVA